MLQHEMKNCVQLPRAEAIAQLNDQLRKTGAGGMVMVTRGVAHHDHRTPPMGSWVVINAGWYEPVGAALFAAR